LLDENGHFADEVHRLAAFLEDAGVPFDAIDQFVNSALVGMRPILKLTELEHRGSDLAGKFLLLAEIPLDPLHHFAAFMMAEELNVSYKTVVNACSQLKQKLNAKILPELIRAAVQLVSAES
jgi:hypothetical protein